MPFFAIITIFYATIINMNPELPDLHQQPVVEGTNAQAVSDVGDFNDPHQRLRYRVNSLFDEIPDGTQRIAELKRRLGTLLQFIDKPPGELNAELDSCAEILSKEEFVAKVTAILKPIADASVQRPQEFEKVAREEFRAQGGFTPVNDLLAYGIHDTVMHLHAMQNKTAELRQKLGMLKDGMKRIAQIVRDNEAVQEVTATSWIVAEHPKLLERMGFTVEGPITDEMRAKHFQGDPRAISLAKISREELLRRYV